MMFAYNVKALISSFYRLQNPKSRMPDDSPVLFTIFKKCFLFNKHYEILEHKDEMVCFLPRAEEFCGQACKQLK